MSQSTFSLDHHLAELRQVGEELRSARYADQVRHAGSNAKPSSLGLLFRDLLSSLQGGTRPNRLATH
jgi:hypothetical protein